MPVCECAHMHVLPPTKAASPYKAVRIYKRSQVLYSQSAPRAIDKEVCREISTINHKRGPHAVQRMGTKTKQKNKRETFLHKL